MKKALYKVAAALLGILSIILLGNIFIHLCFYLFEGHMGNFLHTAWLFAFGLTAISCGAFYYFVIHRKMV